ncbi:MAG: beta-lactamase family protein [Alphaproteobacteria bacterium]|nr:beta-lactamase family protein [Alphaproteobacteria bacterium]MBL6936888.1 beta-lactamase family protein [Alphaproteobacteria bacterium]
MDFVYAAPAAIASHLQPPKRTARPAFAVVVVALLLFQAPPAVARDRFDGVRESIRTMLVERRVPSVAVAVAQHGRILWEEGFGLADRERNIPATANTMYSLASISKPLTATALMTLVRAGKIDLDKPINDYLGTAKLTARVGDARDATIRRVADHSSGLPEYHQFFYYNEPWRRPSVDETIRRYGNLVAPPGEHFEYSNLGYGVLSDVISRVSGKSFADYMRDAVFRPLGMARTAVRPDPSPSDGQAIGYDDHGEPIPYYNTDHDGASAVYASAHDLVRFGMFSLKAHLVDQTAVLPDSLIDAMQAPAVDQGDGTWYGLGWEISHASGYRIVSHDGGMPGVRTELRLVPAAGLAVVVLCNANDRIAPMVADEILAVMLPNYNVPSNPPKPQRPDFVPPPELVGIWKGKISTYSADLPLTLQVMASGEVQVELGSQLKTLLNHPHISSDGYLVGAADGSLEIADAARRPYVLAFKLKLRGKTLSGAVKAAADDDGVMSTNGLYPAVAGYPQPDHVQTHAFLLPQWAELIKQQDALPN